MTTYLLPTSTTLLEKKNGGRGFVVVISTVVPRPWNCMCAWRPLAKLRLWREGTDPALRGREGRRKVQLVTGGAT